MEITKEYLEQRIKQVRTNINENDGDIKFLSTFLLPELLTIKDLFDEEYENYKKSMPNRYAGISEHKAIRSAG